MSEFLTADEVADLTGAKMPSLRSSTELSGDVEHAKAGANETTTLASTTDHTEVEPTELKAVSGGRWCPTLK